MRPDRNLSRTRDGGFSLIELLVATTLGLLLLAGLGTLFVATSRSYRENDLIAGMQDQARFAMATLSRDLSMAGYWGGMMGTDGIVPNLANESVDDDISRATVGLPPASDCGPAGTTWTFNIAAPLEFRNQDSAGAIAGQWNCIAQARAGTDALAMRHVSGQVTGQMSGGDGDVTLRAFHFYLQTNGTLGTLTRWGAAAKAAPDALEQPALAPMSFHRYYPRIYFVRDWSLTRGDGVPTLCRKELCPSGYASNSDPELATCGGGSASAAGYFSECIAEGVEDLQLVWGLDNLDDNDETVDHYSTAPTAAEVARQARSVQVHMLVRSRRSDGLHVDRKTYQLGDKDPFTPATTADSVDTPGDQQTRHFYRRAYSTTVQLRNLGIQGGTAIK
ncbi:MAG: pilin-like protein [Panacagrimonas sp.]|jgi:prepilin-type N-terminal cleavage/methylation domain-containing protein|nr:PilW family protein [Panacagrimonas sp.]MCC2655066.1 pilin-like protein [Panacagrimonas sp.]